MEQELIPGLPDDVATDCLLRLHYRCHHSLKLVSKAWNALLSSPSYYHHRRLARKTETFVFVVRDVPRTILRREGYYGAVSLYSLSDEAWSQLPKSTPMYPPGFASNRCVGVGSKVLLLGGLDTAGAWEPTGDVYVYDFARAGDGWRRRAPMPTTRIHFSFAVVGSTIFVAGGVESASDEKLQTAEAYDVAADEWRRMPDMKHIRGAGSVGHSVGGRFEVVGKEGTREIFCPCKWEWVAPTPSMDGDRIAEGFINKKVLCFTTASYTIEEDDDATTLSAAGFYIRRKFTAVTEWGYLGDVGSTYYLVTGKLWIRGRGEGKDDWQVPTITWLELDPPLEHDFPTMAGWATIVQV